MSTLLQDLQAAWRTLRAVPGSTLAAVVILALGTGANTAVLAMTYGILFRPLPYTDVSRLVLMSIVVRDGTETSFQRADVDGLIDELAVADAVAGYANREMTVRGAGDPRLLHVNEVTPGFFDALGVPAAIGRAAVADDSGSGLVVSDRFARELSPGAPAGALGHTLTVGERSLPIVGVMPSSFAFPSDAVDVWTLAPPPPGPLPNGQRQIEWPRYRALVRARPGVTREQLEEDAVRVLRATRGQAFGQPGSALLSLRFVEDVASSETRPALMAAALASGLVLVVACANVGVLLLGIQARRTRDLAVRLALGASGWRLVRATFVESLLLAGFGSVLGLAIAMTVVRGFVTMASGLLPRLHDVAIDLPVLAGATALGAIVAVACGMAPALTVARRDFLRAFRGHTNTSPATERLRTGLIVAQIALSFVLVAGTGLLARTVVQLSDVDTGINPEGVVTARIVLSDDMLADAGARSPMLQTVLQRVRALPGVQAAGIGGSLPPTVAPTRIFVSLVSDSRNDFTPLSVVSASPGYFEAMGVRLISGRFLQEGDGELGEAVVLSESAERFFAPDKDLTGQELGMRMPPIVRYTRPRRVVGVVRDVKYAGLDAPAPASIYVPWELMPSGTSYLVVRSAQTAASLAPAIRDVLRDADPAVPAPLIRSMDDQVALSIASRRLRLIPAAGFAGVALAMSLVGLVVTLMRAVNDRRRELAIRAAVGASPARLTRMVLTEGVRVTLAGLVAGIALTLAMAGSVGHLLYGVGPYDPVTLGGVTLLIAIAALCASLIPARRAAQAQPVELLRVE